MNQSGKKILIIDDNQELRSSYRELLLLSFRCSVDEAKNGLEGLVRAKESRPDLILLDYVMPGMDGEQFLKSIRCIPSLRGIPVIVMTSENEKEDVQRFLSLGISGYLIKPISLATVIDRVVKIIGKEYLFAGSEYQAWIVPAGNTK